MVLDAEICLARGIQTALLESTLELLFPQHDTITAVMEEERGGLKEIGQVHLYKEAAYLMYIYPGDLACVADACALLDGLVRMAGERGSHFVLAAIEENNPIHYGLRQSGFRPVYSHKIWQINPVRQFSTNSEYKWTPVVEKDYLPLLSIYQQCVPPAVQSILPFNPSQLPTLMLSVNQDVKGFAYLHQYAQAAFLYPYVSPSLSDVSQGLSSLVSIVNAHTRTFVVVPSFENWLENARMILSATTVMKQQVLVKYIALRQKATQTVRSRLAVPGHTTEPTTPIAPTS